MQEEIEKLYGDRMSQLTNKELIILYAVILELSKNVRQEAYITGDKNLFMKKLKNIGSIEVENEETGETIKIRQKYIMKAFNKFKKIRLLEMDQDGLPLFFPDVIPLSHI